MPKETPKPYPGGEPVNPSNMASTTTVASDIVNGRATLRRNSTMSRTASSSNIIENTVVKGFFTKSGSLKLPGRRSLGQRSAPELDKLLAQFSRASQDSVTSSSDRSSSNSSLPPSPMTQPNPETRKAQSNIASAPIGQQKLPVAEGQPPRLPRSLSAHNLRLNLSRTGSSASSQNGPIVETERSVTSSSDSLAQAMGASKIQRSSSTPSVSFAPAAQANTAHQRRPSVGGGKKGGDKLTIMLVGSPEVGKTAIAQRFVHGIFVERYDRTAEEHFTKILEFDKTAVYLDIVDCGGQWMEDRRLLPTIQSADAFAVIYSLTDPESLTAVDRYIAHIVSVRGSRPPMMLFGNKCDDPSARADLRAIRKLTEKYGLVHVEATATNPRINTALMRLIRTALTGIDSEATDPKADPKADPKREGSGSGRLTLPKQASFRSPISEQEHRMLVLKETLESEQDVKPRYTSDTLKSNDNPRKRRSLFM
eukprot:comp20350_c0_seq1/m.25672 comp20350_c0_seq1/g.25672  ORF comp20350_c0_seq1/g.25672 comp20350_c0_seq1/m.25672 type:complete len:480 (-) comp20350_c0_seq1:743-2182(-)